MNTKDIEKLTKYIKARRRCFYIKKGEIKIIVDIYNDLVFFSDGNCVNVSSEDVIISDFLVGEFLI